MNTAELTYLLQNPSELKLLHLDSLEKLNKAFPYFQSAKALLLKALKDQNSFRYNQELKVTAAYTTDRNVLFDFITSPSFVSADEQQIPEKKEDIEIEVIDSEEIKVAPRMSMDDAVSMQVKEAEEVLDPSLFSSKEIEKDRNFLLAKTLIKESEKTTPTPEIPITSEIEVNKPLDFDKNETHSFTEWLQLMSVKPIDRTPLSDNSDNEEKESDFSAEGKDEVITKRKHKFEMIDSFLSNNPKIKPSDKVTINHNLAKESIVTSDELMTETLARVYLAQNKYKKAIQAYKILILKNPEKSGFFADQIKAIKKLQENK